MFGTESLQVKQQAGWTKKVKVLLEGRWFIIGKSDHGWRHRCKCADSSTEETLSCWISSVSLNQPLEYLVYGPVWFFKILAKQPISWFTEFNCLILTESLKNIHTGETATYSLCRKNSHKTRICLRRPRLCLHIINFFFLSKWIATEVRTPCDQSPPSDQLMQIQPFGFSFFCHSLMIFLTFCSCLLDWKHLQRTGRLRCHFMLRREEWTVFWAAQPNTCSPHPNTMKLSKWIVFCRLSGCSDRGGWGGVKRLRCFTLQHSIDTSDIFIDSNKGQMTKAESKIKQTLAEKQWVVSATVRTCFSDNIILQNRKTNTATRGSLSPTLSARLPPFRLLPNTILLWQSPKKRGE